MSSRMSVIMAGQAVQKSEYASSGPSFSRHARYLQFACRERRPARTVTSRSPAELRRSRRFPMGPSFPAPPASSTLSSLSVSFRLSAFGEESLISGFGSLRPGNERTGIHTYVHGSKCKGAGQVRPRLRRPPEAACHASFPPPPVRILSTKRSRSEALRSFGSARPSQGQNAGMPAAFLWAATI
ncbi:hypothetical protein LX32DRAFT_241589 [Colletotrichum zoysiae]|uniref:Uncharacterized protein n=1 Tax=Colletotrichum zoysiae TaxID=1216348 RepID=A0AAD9H4F2_9PEZI|nr:hypothetical protein LX32DRAFT_241589 [Colletotrichum zoysiae]